MAHSLDPFRTGKAYTSAQAARLAKASPTTVRRWLLGDPSEDRHMDSVFAGEPHAGGDPLLLSFLQLAEVIVAARFTQEGGKLRKVRDAHLNARRRWPHLPYPFASLTLKKLGGEMLQDFDESYGGQAIAISLGGSQGEQWTLPGMVKHALDLFDFDPEDNMATRWFPAGRDVPVVLDPHFAGGQLTVFKRGVTVNNISRRFFKGKQSIAYIARDLDLRRRDVETIVQYTEPAA